MDMPNSPHCPTCGHPVEDIGMLADPITQTIMARGKSVRLTTQQFTMAEALIKAYPSMLTKEQIYDRVFMKANGEGPALKIVDVIICKIRPKLGQLGLLIETSWGRGYRLLEGDPADAAAIKDAGIRLRSPGSANRWSDALDGQLAELMARKYTVTQCAAALRKPYMAVERAMKRLSAAQA